MREGPRKESEPRRDSIPTPEEVREIFNRFIEGGKFEDLRKLEDENGLYFWEVIVKGEDGDTEYTYWREGEYKEGKALETTIHVMFFDKDGMPITGRSVAKYVDGKWRDTP